MISNRGTHLSLDIETRSQITVRSRKVIVGAKAASTFPRDIPSYEPLPTSWLIS